MGEAVHSGFVVAAHVAGATVVVGGVRLRGLQFEAVVGLGTGNDHLAETEHFD